MSLFWRDFYRGKGFDIGYLCIPDGPREGKIAFVGEAPGQEEDKQKIPFVGSSGKELKRMISDAGISPEECLFTNVFMERPPNNQLGYFLTDADTLKEQEQWPSPLPALSPGFPDPTVKLKKVNYIK